MTLDYILLIHSFQNLTELSCIFESQRFCPYNNTEDECALDTFPGFMLSLDRFQSLSGHPNWTLLFTFCSLGLLGMFLAMGALISFFNNSHFSLKFLPSNSESHLIFNNSSFIVV